MQEIFEENKSKMHDVAIIWTPILVTDSLNTAEKREASFSDSCVRHYWDPYHVLGRLLSQTLNLKASIAWDLYLVYPPDHPWETELPPMPEFWMHQLDEEPTLFLNPVQLKRAAQTMIESVKYE